MSSVQADDSYELVMKGWECQETDHGVPFYIHKTDGKTDWDHPYYTKVLEELDAYQDVRYAAYRTALKLRHLQKKFGLHLLSLECLQSVLDDHGFPQGCSGLMDSQCLQLILLDLFHMPDFRHFDSYRQDVASELLHNYLLNLFDGARTGVVKVVSVKLALAALCNSDLSEKYQYFFREIQSSRAFVSRDQLSTFISDIIQIPDLLRESVAFGKNVSAAVDSCVQVAGTLGDGVPEKGFYTWLKQEPQTLIWLPTMHRLIAAETVKHDCKCSVCKAMPIVGFRYKCLQCFKFNICQECFFHCRVAKNHQLRHPIQEYCLPITAKDETKAFLKVVRNKISRRSRGVRKRAFLPVDNTPDQGLLEWEMRPAPSPPSPPSAHQAEEALAGEGEAASNDSGHSSDQGGEETEHKLAEEPSSPSPRSLYDNSSSPARYLEERHSNKSAQDRHSLIHLVHHLRRENRLLRQQLRSVTSHREDSQDTWRSMATAQVTTSGSCPSSSSGRDVTASGIVLHQQPKGESPLQTLSPIGEVSSAGTQGQAYTSDFFNSILASTTATAASLATFDDTGLKSPEDMVFASTPAVLPVSTPQKSGPRKPPRLTGQGEKNTVSISYIHPEDSPVDSEAKPTPTESSKPISASIVHKVQVHGLSDQKRDSSDADLNQHSFDTEDTDYSEIPEDTSVSCQDTEDDCGANTPQCSKNPVSCDEMWADITPCTIRKKASKPMRLVEASKKVSRPLQLVEEADDSHMTTPKVTDSKARRFSTGSVTTEPASDVSVGPYDTLRASKTTGSFNKLNMSSPTVDKSLFSVSCGDSILKTPERQEIDKMIEWIDKAFPSDLSYSALSLCPDESSGQTHMLQAAEGISQAMADLVQATADQCYA